MYHHLQIEGECFLISLKSQKVSLPPHLLLKVNQDTPMMMSDAHVRVVTWWEPHLQLGGRVHEDGQDQFLGLHVGLKIFVIVNAEHFSHSEIKTNILGVTVI